MPLPYINYDRSIGFSVGALPMLLFNPVEKDTLSPSSIAGMFGMYTSNDTWFLMGFSALFLDEDNWRIMGAAGRGSVNFQFYLNNPIDIWVPYNTQADFVYLSVKRRVVKDPKIYAGAKYIYTTFKTSTELFPDTTATYLHGVGIDLMLDQRSSFYYPRSGFITNLGYTSYPDAFGNEYVSNKIELDHNHFFPTRERQDVIAARFFAGLGIGDLNFNQQFIIGDTDIRGYTQGAFRGNYQLALQGEYRYNFHQRWGVVGFMGFSTIFESINSDDDGMILPGIGAGFRFTADTETHMNVGVDVAAGKDDWGIYFRLGESF